MTEEIKVHEYVSIAFEAVMAVVQDPQLFQRSADLTRQVKDGTLPAEEAARQIAQDSPEVASLLDRLPATVRHALIWIVLTAISILAAQKWAELHDHSATTADVERSVAQHDRDTHLDLQREVELAVDRALKEYSKQHPSALGPPRASEHPTQGGRERERNDS